MRRIYAINIEVNWFEEYSALLKGLGIFPRMKGEYKIEIKENAKPYAISVPRAIPILLKYQVKEALHDMQKKESLPH